MGRGPTTYWTRATRIRRLLVECQGGSGPCPRRDVEDRRGRCASPPLGGPARKRDAASSPRIEPVRAPHHEGDRAPDGAGQSAGRARPTVPNAGVVSTRRRRSSRDRRRADRRGRGPRPHTARRARGPRPRPRPARVGRRARTAGRPPTSPGGEMRGQVPTRSPRTIVSACTPPSSRRGIASGSTGASSRTARATPRHRRSGFRTSISYRVAPKRQAIE